MFNNNFASITRPLSRLTSENVAFLWAEECELAFKYLKISLMTRPVLVFPKFDKDFIVEVDASEMAIGGVLSQYQEDGKIHPVAYFSKALNPNQIKWSVYNKEAYTMVSAVQHWYVYLYGNKFILNSDHNPLTFLQHKKDPKGKIGRWIAELEGFDFKVEYIPGRNNVKADALSRNRNASEKDSYSDILEDNIYVVSTENTSFTEQLRQEQESDRIISNAKKLVLDGMPVNEGQLKRITKQLRIERGILSKSGRPIVPSSMKRYVVDEFHKINNFGTNKVYSCLIACCEICSKCKTENHPPKAPLLPIHEPEAPMEFISLDIGYVP